MKPLPQSLYDRAELLSRVHDQATVAMLIGKDQACVSRMKARGWKAAQLPRRPVPTDFGIQAHHMTYAEMSAHYCASNYVIARWLRESGIKKKHPGPRPEHRWMFGPRKRKLPCEDQ